MKYQTAMGKTIDMAALAAKNEKTRAVGNMNVNARGDTIDADNNIINDNTKRVQQKYDNTVKKPAVANSDTKIRTEAKVNVEELTPEEREFEE